MRPGTACRWQTAENLQGAWRDAVSDASVVLHYAYRCCCGYSLRTGVLLFSLFTIINGIAIPEVTITSFLLGRLRSLLMLCYQLIK